MESQAVVAVQAQVVTACQARPACTGRRMHATHKNARVTRGTHKNARVTCAASGGLLASAHQPSRGRTCHTRYTACTACGGRGERRLHRRKPCLQYSRRVFSTKNLRNRLNGLACSRVTGAGPGITAQPGYQGAAPPTAAHRMLFLFPQVGQTFLQLAQRPTHSFTK